MEKITLSEIPLIYGPIDMPKGFDIDRDKIKNDIITSFIDNKRITNNNKSYSYDDFNIPFSQPLQWLKDYIRDHIKAEYDFTLIDKSQHGNVYNPKEKSFIRHQVDPVDLRNSPDYTLVYGTFVGKDSCELVIEYDDNRRKYRTWHIPIKNNYFYMFPSTQRYFITENKSEQMNVLLTINYEFI